MSKAWFRFVSLKVHFNFGNKLEEPKICLINNHACIKFLLKKSIKVLKLVHIFQNNSTRFK